MHPAHGRIHPCRASEHGDPGRERGVEVETCIPPSSYIADGQANPPTCAVGDSVRRESRPARCRAPVASTHSLPPTKCLLALAAPAVLADTSRCPATALAAGRALGRLRDGDRIAGVGGVTVSDGHGPCDCRCSAWRTGSRIGPIRRGRAGPSSQSPTPLNHADPGRLSGGGGTRTHDRGLPPMPVFKTGAKPNCVPVVKAAAGCRPSRIANGSANEHDSTSTHKTIRGGTRCLGIPLAKPLGGTDRHRTSWSRPDFNPKVAGSIPARPIV